MSDGQRLRQSWTTALEDAQDNFRSLLISSSSPSGWRRIVVPTNETLPSIAAKGKARAFPDESDVNVHRRASKSGEILRLVLDVPADETLATMDYWKAVLTTPELRKEWDPGVQNAQHIETLDTNTRISKTYYTLGWPANPRDSITISRTFVDPSTVIDISTSLPRTPDEPGYLRATPPYVRSHVHLQAWCIQLLQANASEPNQASPKVRVTCFWQHDLKTIWGIGAASRPQHLTSLMISLVKNVQRRGHRIPMLRGYGLGVSLNNLHYDVGRESISVSYSIVREIEEADHSQKTMEELTALKERRRLERSMELILPSTVGWDVQLTTRGSSPETSNLPWSVEVIRTTGDDSEKEFLLFRSRHAALNSRHAILKVTLVIEVAGGTGLRLNGSPHPIELTESRDPSTFRFPQPIIQDASTVAGVSFHTENTTDTQQSETASRMVPVLRPGVRTRNGDKSILTLVRRNYVYFASLLQEPEAKWKPLAEARGVTVNQLDSIDPTLVVYRAEAVFVGVGVWDLFSVLSTPGSAAYWDKSFEDATLLEDVNELTDLWHLRTKAAWSVGARETILLRTCYKSPTSVHLFGFSTDDDKLFPNIPASDPSIIRTQVDLQGWAIEALSPTTTQLTLIEQSDPKGWSNRTSISQQMIATVAGVGEYAIKAGGPPFVSRLGAGRMNSVKFDQERNTLAIEYEADTQRRASSALINPSPSDSQASLIDSNAGTQVPGRPYVECELRCDVDTWAPWIEIVIDPPAQGISCLRRHKLSENGGGLWLTIEHDADFVADEILRIQVKKGAPVASSKEKSGIFVNGARIKVEVEEMPEADLKVLAKKKRVKPVRIPLDQPPVVSAIQRKRAEWDEEADGGNNSDSARLSSSAPKFGSPITKFFTNAFVQASTSTAAAANAAVTAVTKPPPFVPPNLPNGHKSSKVPLQHALEGLAYLRSLYNRPASFSKDAWTLVNDTNGLSVHKRLETEVSTSIPVHRAEKVFEGYTAEDIANVLSHLEIRKHWDDRFDSATVLEEYGGGASSYFAVMKGGFPFRDRGLLLASVLGRASGENTSTRPGKHRTASEVARGVSSSQPTLSIIYFVVASFHQEAASKFTSTKYNPLNLPIGRMHLQGWVLETLDPYTAENFTIPSARCTMFSCLDFAGAVPVAYNAMLNSTLPRMLLGLETFMKSQSLLPPSVRDPPAGFAVEATEGLQEGWSFERRCEERILVSSRWDHGNKQFSATILLEAPSTQQELQIEDKTPTPSRFVSRSTLSAAASPTSETVVPSPPPSSVEDRLRQEPRVLHPRSGSASTSRPRVERISSPSPRRSIGQGVQEGVKDMLVGEFVLDASLYPRGVTLQTSSSWYDRSSPLSLNGGPTTSGQCELPIVTSIYTLPISPLQSAPKAMFLVRLTLPTAIYEAPEIDDPLTGEPRRPPAKPTWLVDLAQKGAVVVVEMNRAEGSGFGITANGLSVEVLNERRSLASLGRLLMKESGMNMPWLLRSDDVEFPRVLVEPLGVATGLRDPIEAAKLVSPVVPNPDLIETPELNKPPQGEGAIALNIVPTETGRNAFGGLFNAYNTSVSWLSGAFVSKNNSSSAATSKANGLDNNNNVVPGPESLDAAKDDKEDTMPAAEVSLAISPKIADGRQRMVPVSTVVVVGLICFLLGSLLRSLMSPSDFVYTGKDRGEEDGEWRELQRLVHLKYIVPGGWDIVVGLVHRG